MRYVHLPFHKKLMNTINTSHSFHNKFIKNSYRAMQFTVKSFSLLKYQKRKFLYMHLHFFLLYIDVLGFMQYKMYRKSEINEMKIFLHTTDFNTFLVYCIHDMHFAFIHWHCNEFFLVIILHFLLYW